MPTLAQVYKGAEYVGGTPPIAERTIWAYRYHRAKGAPALAALAAARVEATSGKVRFSSSAVKLGYSSGRPFAAYGESHMRWIESPAAAGLRFVGYADQIAGRGGVWPGRRMDHSGWYTDDDCGDLVRGVVYQIAGARGRARYIAGHDNSDNGAADRDGPACVSFDDIFEGDKRDSSYDDDSGARDAAYAADRIAERMAESEREYRAAWQAGRRYDDLGAEIAAERRRALALFAERRAAASGVDAADIPTICETIDSALRAIWEGIQESRAERSELLRDYGTAPGFVE